MKTDHLNRLGTMTVGQRGPGVKKKKDHVAWAQTGAEIAVLMCLQAATALGFDGKTEIDPGTTAGIEFVVVKKIECKDVAQVEHAMRVWRELLKEVTAEAAVRAKKEIGDQV